MGGTARLGVVCLMLLAVGLARLVEVELDPGNPPTLVVPAQPTAAPSIEESPTAAAATPALPPPPPQPAAPPPSADDAPWPAGRTYVVRPGESLGSISKKVYGTTRHWKELHAANRDVIPDPTRMRPGVKLKLPRIDGR